MEEQSYAKHAKYAPLYHFFAFPVILLCFIGSLVNFSRSLDDPSRFYNAALIAALCTALVIVTLMARVFPLKAQDRAIRAEENLRHFAMTGKLLDRRLTIKQIVALRFASDEEFVALAAKAANENMKPDDVKKSIKSWRADHDRL
jgi:hypothetical protein